MATRRRFIRDCSALAASAAFLPTLTPAAPRRLHSITIATVPYADLAGLLGASFVARGPLGPQGLELVGVERWSGAGLDSGQDGRAWESFSLYFRGDPAGALGQDTYHFEQARLGRFEMFIVPVDRPEADGCWYEAVFHRLAPAEFPSRRPRFSGAAPRSEST